MLLVGDVVSEDVAGGGVTGEGVTGGGMEDGDGSAVDTDARDGGEEHMEHVDVVGGSTGAEVTDDAGDGPESFDEGLVGGSEGGAVVGVVSGWPLAVSWGCGLLVGVLLESCVELLADDE